jgi:hypothetical protein
VPKPDDLRANAALCLCALATGNATSREAAKAAGAVEAVATLFDASSEWEGAYLGAMAMQALGLSDPPAMEKALGAQDGTEADGDGDGGRLGTLRAVWAMKTEPELWGH